MNRKPPKDASEPRGSVEILPPEDEDERANSRVWIAGGSREFRIVKLGPVGSALLAVAAGLVSLLAFIFFASFLLVLIPVLAAIFLILYFFGGRDLFRRPR